MNKVGVLTEASFDLRVGEEQGLSFVKLADSNFLAFAQVFSDLDFLIIEDSYLNGPSTWDFLKSNFSLSRIFVLSKYDDLNTVRNYLNKGIGDFFSHPVSSSEVTAKIERATRSSRRSSFLSFAKSGFTLRQSQIMELLEEVGHKGVSREMILKRVWSTEKVDPKNVDVQIHNLRKCLQKRGQKINFNEGRWFLCEA